MKQFAMPDFLLAAPEIFILTMASIILVVDLFLHDRNRVVTYLLSLLTLVAAVILTIVQYTGETKFTFSGMYVSDPMGDLLKIAIYVSTAMIFIYSRGYLAERNIFKGEFYVLGLFGMLGMMVMVSAHSFLTIYLGLELLSLSVYAMVALHRDSLPASEAAMKYFVLGALASGMLLYGMSILYGVTGSLDISVVSDNLVSNMQEKGVVLAFALVFVIIGLAFKLGAVPFHMWVPDVYHGAPTVVTGFIGTAPKIAAFAMVMRLLIEGLGQLHAQWQDILIILSILSLAVGNIIAIAQTNLKRMLAYSTISHVGFILLGFIAGTDQGYSASMFYIMTYALMALGAFGIIILLSRAGFEADKLDDIKGLDKRNRWYAFLMMILMFSMAGVPPTVGFHAKWQVLQSIVAVDLVWLAAVAVAFSIIGAFYYLRIVKLIYFDEPNDKSAIKPHADMHYALSVNGLAILYLGIFPGALITACAAVFAG